MDGGEIGAREAWQWLHGARAAPFYVLDVRNEDDFARWRLDGAVHPPTVNVPYFAFVDDPDAALARVPRHLGEAAVVCAKGDSSEFVRDVLRDAGLAAVNVRGGMAAWGDLHVPLRVPLPDDAVELWQVSRYGKGCLSYLVVSGGEAAVVDPSRFVEGYEALARERGARIVEVLDTHVHADHLSGGPALARRAVANYRVLGGAGEEHAAASAPLRDRARLSVGEAAIDVLRTPGHTPGSTSFLVADAALLSGDTLFVGGVGRPDLGGKIDAWGRVLHRSLREVVGELPGVTTVLPAHFCGPADADAGGLVRATLAELRARSPELSIGDPAEFVEWLRAGASDPPPAYAEMARANLGLLDPGERAAEWELGKNECAAHRPR